MNVFVCGLTGSGKTSVAAALARRLGWSLVRGSDVRQAMLGLGSKLPSADFWRFSDDSIEYDTARIGDPSRERFVEDRLLDLAAHSTSTIFDVWFVPWLLPRQESFSLYLDFGLETRVNRVSPGQLSLEQVLRLVAEKDARAKEFAMKAYAVDISDLSIFDAIVPATSALTSEQIAEQIAYVVQPPMCQRDLVGRSPHPRDLLLKPST